MQRINPVILVTLLISIVFSNMGFADPSIESISWYNIDSGSQLPISTDPGSGDDGSELEVYLPYQTGDSGDGGAADQDRFYTRFIVTADDDLPSHNAGTSQILDGVIVLEVRNNSGSTLTYQVGLETDTDDRFVVVPLSTTIPETDVDDITAVSFDLTAGSTTSLSVYFGEQTGNPNCLIDITSEVTCRLAVFAVTTPNSENTEVDIDTDDTDNYFFMNLNLKSFLGDDTGGELPDVALERGDEEIFLSWSFGTITSGLTQSDVRRLRIATSTDVAGDTANIDSQNYVDVSTAVAGASDLQIYSANEAKDSNGNAFSFTENVANGNQYVVGICIEDDWGFCTFFSPAQTITPAALETFLDEQSCYLFSAGFKTDHYVLSRLRKFRDEIILGTYLGDLFIDFYYETAPAYAIKIAKNKYLSGLFKGLGFIAYGLIEYFFEIIYGFLVLALLVFGLRRFLLRV